MNKYYPLVSILISYYNDSKYLSRCIASILCQSYSNFQLILLNHASEDCSRNIAHSFKDSRIFHLDVEQNLGAGSLINLEKMLNISQGKYIKLFCADDIMHKDCILNLVNYMQENKHIDFAFGNVEYIDEFGKFYNENWFNNRSFFSKNLTEVDIIKLFLKDHNVLPFIGSIIKTSCLKTIKFDPTLICYADVYIWLSLLCKNYKIGFINKIVSFYRIHSAQISNVNRLDLDLCISYYEKKYIWKVLLTIDDVTLLKKIFPADEFVSKLEDKEDIGFCIANILFYKFKPSPYEYLLDLINDEKKRVHFENKYKFGIKEFRKKIGKIDEFSLNSYDNNYIYKYRFRTPIYSFFLKIFSKFSLKKRVQRSKDGQFGL